VGARGVCSAQAESLHNRGQGPQPHGDRQTARRYGDGKRDRAFEPGAPLRPSGALAIIPERISRTPDSSEHRWILHVAGGLADRLGGAAPTCRYRPIDRVPLTSLTMGAAPLVSLAALDPDCGGAPVAWPKRPR
jgi:hypothetical protein